MRLAPAAAVFGLVLLAASLAHAQAAAPGGECDELFEQRRYARALQACTREAEAGDLAAEFRLGNLLYEGASGVPRDPAAGVRWYEKAAARGHLGAKFELVLHHMQDASGEGYRRGLKLMREIGAAGLRGAAQARDQAAYCAERLATIYAQGLGVEVDLVEARTWLAAAQALGAQHLAATAAELDDRLSPGERQQAVERLERLKRGG